MNKTEQKFEPITEGEIVKEFGITDHTGKTHTCVVIKREVESKSKTKKYDWLPQIEDYEFVACKLKKADAVEALEGEATKIGQRTPAQYKYGKALENALGGVDYHLNYVVKFFRSAERDLEDARRRFNKATRPHDLETHGKNAALNAAIARIGEEFFHYVEKAKDQYADNAIDFVFRVAELLSHYRSEAIKRVTYALIKPQSLHFSDKQEAEAHAHFLGDHGIDGTNWHLEQFDKALEEIKSAQLVLALNHERPHAVDLYSTSRAAVVWRFYKKQEQAEEVAK